MRSELLSVCLGCFKRANVYLNGCKVILCDSSGENLEFGYKSINIVIRI